MKNSIKIGSIQRRPSVSLTTNVCSQVKKMKLGEFFEITGIDLNTVNSLRASLSYHSKKEGFRVKTKYQDNVLTVDRVRK